MPCIDPLCSVWRPPPPCFFCSHFITCLFVSASYSCSWIDSSCQEKPLSAGGLYCLRKHSNESIHMKFGLFHSRQMDFWSIGVTYNITDGCVYSSAPVSACTTPAKWNSASVTFIVYSCAFLTVTCQIDFHEKWKLFSVILWPNSGRYGRVCNYLWKLSKVAGFFLVSLSCIQEEMVGQAQLRNSNLRAAYQHGGVNPDPPFWSLTKPLNSHRLSASLVK